MADLEKVIDMNVEFVSNFEGPGHTSNKHSYLQQEQVDIAVDEYGSPLNVVAFGAIWNTFDLVAYLFSLIGIPSTAKSPICFSIFKRTTIQQLISYQRQGSRLFSPLTQTPPLSSTHILPLTPRRTPLGAPENGEIFLSQPRLLETVHLQRAVSIHS